jgi:glycosyltransferase involved in cell wall biosynthesis
MSAATTPDPTAAPRVLMLAPPGGVRGPIPTIAPLLAAGMRELGCVVETAPWGRRAGDESPLDTVLGRALDLLGARARCRRSTCDVLLVHTSHDWKTLARDLPLVLVCRAGVGSVVLMIHGSRVESLSRRPLAPFSVVTRLLVSLADAVLVLSSEEQRAWDKVLPGRRFYVVANPFVTPVGPRASLATGNARHDAFELLYVGRLIEEKGVFDLVAAMAELGPGRAARLRIAGDGPDDARLRARIAELELADRVELCGHVGGAALWRLYASADLFVLPTFWKEGFPTVLSEAMGMGLPIVTTPVRGAADHLREGVNAAFVPPHDPGALAAAIVRLMDDPELCRAMAQHNRAKVADFAPATVARTYVEAMVEALRARAVPA